jgi:hypothetical protein
MWLAGADGFALLPRFILPCALEIPEVAVRALLA